MRGAAKLASVREIEAVIGRELTQAERDALYLLPGGVERLESSKRRPATLRRELLGRAAELAREADERHAQAKTLRGVARAIGMHKGVSGEAWAGLIAVSLAEGGAECPLCGAMFEPEAPGWGECPHCGADLELKGDEASWLASVGPDCRPMADIAAVADRGGRP